MPFQPQIVMNAQFSLAAILSTCPFYTLFFLKKKKRIIRPILRVLLYLLGLDHSFILTPESISNQYTDIPNKYSVLDLSPLLPKNQKSDGIFDISL